MSDFQRMSESERMIMELVWTQTEALTSAQIIAMLDPRTSWKPSTVWTFLGRLTEKGLLEARREGKTNYYYPAVTREEYKHRETLHFMSAVHSGSIQSFFAALSGGKALSPQEREELRDWLDGQQEEQP